MVGISNSANIGETPQRIPFRRKGDNQRTPLAQKTNPWSINLWISLPIYCPGRTACAPSCGHATGAPARSMRSSSGSDSSQ